jgi:hypothetical protein
MAARAGKAMLIVSCVLPDALRDALGDKFSVTFVDRIDLLSWAATEPALVEPVVAGAADAIQSRCRKRAVVPGLLEQLPRRPTDVDHRLAVHRKS